MEYTNKDKDKNKTTEYQKNIHCPIDNKILGKYDIRYGVINATYYCKSCKREYTFTVNKFS